MNFNANVAVDNIEGGEVFKRKSVVLSGGFCKYLCSANLYSLLS